MLVALLKAMLLLVCVLLTLLAVLQDTKGGGLAGALVGYGGGSVFGAEAGGRIVRWTSYLAAAFFCLVLLLGKCAHEEPRRRTVVDEGQAVSAPAVPRDGESVEIPVPAPVQPEGEPPAGGAPSPAPSAPESSEPEGG
jgi:preprotein translocase subunit SecG